jgi:hypothetical protein
MRGCVPGLLKGDEQRKYFVAAEFCGIGGVGTDSSILLSSVA